MKIEWNYDDYEGLTRTQIREITPRWPVARAGRGRRAALTPRYGHV
jgi:hypothetical protein